LLYDALDMKFRELKLRKDPACPICGEHRTIDHLIDYEVFCGSTIQGVSETETSGAAIEEITVTELNKRLKAGLNGQH